jgi:hypothetical protein
MVGDDTTRADCKSVHGSAPGLGGARLAESLRKREDGLRRGPMAQPRFADDDDLPRTLRRERDAREREAREREMAGMMADDPMRGQAGPGYGPPYAYEPAPAGDGTVTVTRLRIPFFHLIGFFLKAVIAAIPALILLTVLLWGLGQGLKAFFPGLRHLEIIVKSAT